MMNLIQLSKWISHSRNGEQEVEVGIKDGKSQQSVRIWVQVQNYRCKGSIVSPGMIDAHVHITEPGGGYRDEWEGYDTGTRAAAKAV
ncbi:hypothetical protein PO124_10280 [Bacillus licheniformis]|nr:hypothetical protein [Bacillus licheniformis]